MNLILGFDREKSKVKVKALTLTHSRCTVKSENQKVSQDYQNYIFGKQIKKIFHIFYI